MLFLVAFPIKRVSVYSQSSGFSQYMSWFTELSNTLLLMTSDCFHFAAVIFFKKGERVGGGMIVGFLSGSSYLENRPNLVMLLLKVT